MPGDIGVIAKVDELVFDSVIHASHEHDNIKMKPLSFPKPMFGLAISPARRGDEGRLSDILHKLLSEDPTLELEHDTTLNETVLRGLSAQHLRSVLERMAAQFKLEVNTRTPRIPYRETIAQGAEGHAAPASSVKSIFALNRVNAEPVSNSLMKSKAAQFRTTSSRL